MIVKLSLDPEFIIDFLRLPIYFMAVDSTNSNSKEAQILYVFHLF